MTTKLRSFEFLWLWKVRVFQPLKSVKLIFQTQFYQVQLIFYDLRDLYETINKFIVIGTTECGNVKNVQDTQQYILQKKNVL